MLTYILWATTHVAVGAYLMWKVMDFHNFREKRREKRREASRPSMKQNAEAYNDIYREAVLNGR